MRRLTILLALVILATPASYAECRGDTCIDVSTDQEGNQVVVTVKKGSPGSSSTSSPRARSSNMLRRPWIPWLPRPAVTRPAQPRPRTSSKPRVRTISGNQISDQVRSVLPTGTIITQPLQNILVNEPVNFITNVPIQFTTVIVVLRIPITIHLTALYFWDFGDGKSLVTKLPGAPYPAMLIPHTYEVTGERDVTLVVRWSGFWSAGAISAPINGTITQQIQRKISIIPAHSRFTR